MPASGSARYAPNTESTSSGDGPASGCDASLGAPPDPVDEAVAGLFFLCRLPTSLALGFVARSIFVAPHLHLHLRSNISTRLCAVASFMEERSHLRLSGGRARSLTSVHRARVGTTDQSPKQIALRLAPSDMMTTQTSGATQPRGHAPRTAC